MLRLCNIESGGINIRGASSTGKTTLLTVAGSVWGGGGIKGYIRSWRATTNGLEGLAALHCDALLILDELSQVAPQEAGEAAYMLANGAGKSRSRKDGSARSQMQWRLLFLSSGEISLADKLAEGGRDRRPAAGQQVRIVDIPADAGVGMGVFETLHGFETAQALSDHLKAAASECYGTAAPAFIEAIARDREWVSAAAEQFLQNFLNDYVPPEADGQVRRVALRFALIAAAGEMATALDILPWEPGEATCAVARCFRDWLAERGGVEPAEIRDGIAQVRDFFVAYGTSRFEPAWEEDAAASRIPERAGFRKRVGEGEDAAWEYYVTPAAWKNQVCRGFNARTLAATLAERGLLQVPEAGKHRAKLVTVRGYGKMRLYHVSPRILEGDADD